MVAGIGTGEEPELTPAFWADGSPIRMKGWLKKVSKSILSLAFLFNKPLRRSTSSCDVPAGILYTNIQNTVNKLIIECNNLSSIPSLYQIVHIEGEICTVLTLELN